MPTRCSRTFSHIEGFPVSPSLDSSTPALIKREAAHDIHSLKTELNTSLLMSRWVRMQPHEDLIPLPLDSRAAQTPWAYLANTHFEIISFKILGQRPDISQLVPLEHAAEATFLKSDFLPF